MELVTHRKARQNYQILSSVQAGIALTGAEVKSLRQGHASLVGSFVRPIGSELFLVNCQITPYQFASQRDFDQKRTRKLLLKKREIYHLLEQIEQKGATLIPLSFELVHNQIKLVIGVARGKKQFERRAELKARSIDRSLARAVKQQYR